MFFIEYYLTSLFCYSALFQSYTISTSQANVVSKLTEPKLGPDDRLSNTRIRV